MLVARVQRGWAVMTAAVVAPTPYVHLPDGPRAPSLLDILALDAFVQEHRRCGEREGDVEGERVWIMLRLRRGHRAAGPSVALAWNAREVSGVHAPSQQNGAQPGRAWRVLGRSGPRRSRTQAVA